MKYLLTLLSLIVVFLTPVAHSRTVCETYSHVQMKEKYQANFLNKDFQGCFSYSYDPSNTTSPQSMISIRLGDHHAKINVPTTAKIAYEAFTSFVNTEKSNKALSNDVNQILADIRVDSRLAAAKIDRDLVHFEETYNREAIPQLKINQTDLKSDSQLMAIKVNAIEKKTATLTTIRKDLMSPDLSFGRTQKNQSMIEREKEKWTNLSSKKTMPFRSLEKIQRGNNQELVNALLKEIKTERYYRQGLIQNLADAPKLNQVIEYEKSENALIQKFELLKNSTVAAKEQSKEDVQFYKELSSEFKNEAESNLIQGKLETANDSLDMAHLALDLATSLPIIATGRGLYEFFSGKSLIDGHKLSHLEKGLSLGTALIDLTPAGVISKGFRYAGILRNTGKRLAERGIIKIGLEESLNTGIKFADTFADVSNQLFARGAIKYSTFKTVLEHKLFFKFIEEEAFITSQKLASNIKSFESISKTLIEEGIEATPKLNQFLANRIHYEASEIAGRESLITTTREYLNLETPFSQLERSYFADEVTRVSFQPYGAFDTTEKWASINMNNNHRLTMQGETGLYTVVSNNNNSKMAAQAEALVTGHNIDQMLIESKFFSSHNVLDLSNEKNLNLLGITKSDLLLDDYGLTQKIGHLAKMNQYDAIIIPGSKTSFDKTKIEEYLNFVILKGF